MAFNSASQRQNWHTLLRIVPAPPPKPAAHWSLAAADMASATEFLDLSGGGYAAIASSAPDADTSYEPVASGAVALDGSTDWLSIDSVLPAVAANTAGAWSMWVKPVLAIPSAYDYLLSFGDTDAGEYLEVSISNAGKLVAIARVAGTTKWVVQTDAAVFSAATWAHVGLNHDGTGPTLYVNGAAPAQTRTTTTDLTVWMADFAGLDNGRIGCYQQNGNPRSGFFAGSVCQVRIYGRSLGAYEMARLGAYDPLRWADADLPMSDGTLYTGRIVGMSPLRQELGRLLEPQFVSSELRVELDNADDVVREELDDRYNLAATVAVVSVGQGTDASDYQVAFTGSPRYPDGVEWGRSRATLILDDALDGDQVVLPTRAVFPADYADAEDKSLYAVVPEVLGDFTAADGQGETVPGFCVDTTAGTGGQFTFGEHLTEIVDVYLNGVSASYAVDQLTGPSLVTLGEAYDSTTDAVTAHVRGRQPESGVSNPIEWCRELLTGSWAANRGGDRVDLDAFDAARSGCYYGAADACRRWIGERVQVFSLVAELARDGFFEVVVSSVGKIRPVFRLAAAAEDAIVVREVDIMPRVGGREYGVRADPERVYVNALTYQFGLVPPTWSGSSLYADRQYGGSGSMENATELGIVGRRISRRVDMPWLCEAAGAQNRATRDLYVFGTRVEMVDLLLGPRALTLAKADTIQLIWDKYGASQTSGTPMMVRSVSPDYLAMTAAVSAWNIDRLAPKRYQDDGAAAWASATDYAKSVMGFYEQNAEQVYM